MYSFASTGKFPSKLSWKTLVSGNIENIESIKFQCAIANEQSLNGIDNIHEGFRVLFGNLAKTIGNIQTGVLQS